MHFFEQSFLALLDNRDQFERFYHRIEIATQRGKLLTD